MTDAAYVGGSLVLYDNGSTVGSFKVGSSYAGNSFDVVPLSTGYSQITIGPSWLNPVSGNFATAADWSTGSVPGLQDSVAISTAGTYTLSVTSSTTVRSIEETDSGATVTIGGSDALTLSGISNINGAVAGSGALDLAGGVTTFDGNGSISAASWSLLGAGTNVALDQALDYSGDFQAGSGTSLTLSGGDLTLTGQAGFAGATVSGSDTLTAEGTTTISALTLGGTATFDNAGALTQSGGDVTVGDAGGSVAQLLNAATGTYDITEDSGIGLGSSRLSSISNSGLFEKTGGTGTSVIAPNVANAQSILVSAATLDFQGAVTGSGTDTISGASTLEFELVGRGWPDDRLLGSRRDTQPDRSAGLFRLTDQRLRSDRHGRPRRLVVLNELQREWRPHARNPDADQRRQQHRHRVRRQLHPEQLHHRNRDKHDHRTHITAPLDPGKIAVGRDASPAAALAMKKGPKNRLISELFSPQWRTPARRHAGCLSRRRGAPGHLYRESGLVVCGTPCVPGTTGNGSTRSESEIQIGPLPVG